MLQASTLQFLHQLQRNNNKPWFDENRAAYESAKKDFQQLVAQLIPAIAHFDPSIAHLQVKDCTFRINRDVRFSKDKRPYKNNLAAYFSAGGKKDFTAGYYFHCEPGKSYVAGGFYGPQPAQLASIRQEIDYNLDEWKKIVERKGFKQQFVNGVDGIESLVRPPKGYDETNPAIHYLKMKNFIVSCPLADEQLHQPALVKTIGGIFKNIQPMIAFLNRAID